METALKRDPAHDSPPPMAVAVVSRSPLMRKRLAATLTGAGYKVTEISGTTAFIRNKRQRPYVVCFFDARGSDGKERALRCFEARPRERYIVIRDTNASGKRLLSSAIAKFGCIADSFTNEEVVDWASRAAADERLAEGEQPLEELLFERFTSFIHEVGSASMSDLHGLILERVERPLLKAVLEWTDGNQSRAAEILGIHRNTLRVKIKALGIAAGE